MKILVVDDDATNRLVLCAYLKKDGYQTVTAENGQRAVEMFQQEHPEMVLMDVMMPVMDGYLATAKIKEISERFIPIIFLTAMTDEKALSRCVEVGGDDFLTKPYSRVILNAKMEALFRVSKLYNTIYAQKHALENHQLQQHKEQELARKVFDSIMNPGCLDEKIFDIHLSPVSLFNGDVVLAAAKPSGGLNILFGDFTGHGLGAALGALPLSEIFYAMTAKSYGIADICAEINAKLKQQLPIGMFLAACVLEVDSSNHVLKVWNGAIPGAYIMPATGELKKLKSTHLPFGILSSSEFDDHCDIVEIFPSDKIILSTDGILEAENLEGEMYGTQRFEQHLIEHAEAEQLTTAMMTAIDDFTQDNEVDDDVTLAVIDCDLNFIEHLASATVNSKNIHDSHWEFSMMLHFDALQKIDPLPIINQILNEVQGRGVNRNKISMVLSELYCNSLDHGLLDLDSAIKSSPQGFMEFYEEKSTRLAGLEVGYIKITIRNKKTETGSMMTIILKDSGKGFDTSLLDAHKLVNNDSYSGRGFPLINEYCESVTYNDIGNRVECVIRIDH